MVQLLLIRILCIDYYLDSLKFLSEQLEIKRQVMFTLIKDIDLAYDDICLIDELNSNSILLHNIINSFGGREWQSTSSVDTTQFRNATGCCNSNDSIPGVEQAFYLLLLSRKKNRVHYVLQKQSLEELNQLEVLLNLQLE